ncbi:MAG: NFACT family protein, partial [Clostridia bacterium]|nr:NFACT family protein [Clostridia bacterium]
ILIDGEGRVIDALKRVDESKSSVRQILPSLEYNLPPSQNKLNILDTSAEEISKTITTMPEKRLSSAILSTLEGVSPIVCRELAYRASYNDEAVAQLDAKKDILPQIEHLKTLLESGKVIPTVVKDTSGKPIDLTFINVCQYGDLATIQNYDSFNELLDDFYYERDRLERTHQKAQDLVQKVNTLIQRTVKKLNVQRLELLECDNKEQLRINAELISANVYNLEKGASSYELFNYYTNETITVKVNPALTPMENSQRYYKEYKKAKTAEEMLKKLIENGEAELKYLETVSDALDRSNTAAEIDEIRDELYQGGYIKSKGKAKKIKALPPIEYETSDGFRVLVGRNNIQNEKLSLKTANKNDMWLHVQSFPGSHVIIVADNKEISDLAIEEAASVAAYHSKARGSKIVTVDYTYVKNLKKPIGAKFGKVIYHVYYSINVSSELTLEEKTGGNR